MSVSTRSSAPPILRFFHPLAFAEFVERVGSPVERLLRSDGLPVYCDHPQAFVPLLDAWSFFETTAENVDPALGWHVGRDAGDRKLGAPLLRKLERAPSLYEALKRLVRMISAEASHLQLGILERGDDLLFHTRYSGLKGVRGYHTSQAYQLEVYLDVIRHFLGRHWVPREIGIELEVAPRVVEEHFPDCRILVGQPMGYISVPRSELHRTPERKPSPGAEPVVLASTFDYVETLKALLVGRLYEGYPSAEKAASLMATSVRTLARNLAASGLTYGTLVDELRFEAATDLLAETDLRITDVATAVGFRDSSNFARMFRRIGGASPGQFRHLGNP